MGVNTFFVVNIISALGYTWQTSFGLALCAGILNLIVVVSYFQGFGFVIS